jgi:periplasmic copper chaperone A
MKPVIWVLAAGVFLASAGAGSTDGLVKAASAWVRPTIGQVNATALYLTLSNNSDTPDALVAITSPVAARSELHVTDVNNAGVVTMRRLDELALPAQTAVSLKPKSVHVMLFGLTGPLRVGDHVPVTLHFKAAPQQTLDAIVSTELPNDMIPITTDQNTF